MRKESSEPIDSDGETIRPSLLNDDDSSPGHETEDGSKLPPVDTDDQEDSTTTIAETLVVYDEEEECPYLSERTARMPLRFPLVSLSLSVSDQLMSAGFRRSGKFLYETQCPNCNACQPIRLKVDAFQPNRSQQRALKKGERELETNFRQATVDQHRVDLFNKHRNVRGMNRLQHDIDAEEYKMFLIESCLQTFEIEYRYRGQLIGIAICDLGENSLSAVYTFYDPDFVHLSPGTYSILKQIEFCQIQELPYLYLGYYVEGSTHMNYKRNFRPHQIRVNGNWRTQS